jgi:nucleotide-binding universal stress UspA family protein
VGPVVCCVDDSDGARHALRFARMLATRLGLELVLVHVEPPTEAPGVSAAPAGQERLREEELHDAESLLARLADEGGLDPEVRARAAIGDTADRIVTICGEEQASFVVLGSRGRGGLASALLGSVSSEVAAKAPCVCVIVPPTARHVSFA